MRFGLVHRIMVDALVTLGILAVVSTSAMNPWTIGLVLAGLVFALAMPETWQTSAFVRHLSTIGPLTLFVVQVARVLTGRSPLDVAVEFAAFLQILRVMTRRGAAHDQQLIVLALLHFVVGTVLGGGLAFGLCFLGFLLVVPGAMVLSHLRREVEGNYRQGARDRTGLPVDVPRILRSRRVVGRGFLAVTSLLAIPIFIFTATLFVLFPRIGLSLLLLNHPRQGRMVGFSDHVDLGEVGVLRSDPSVALRFDLSDTPDPPPPRLTLRLRGTAFDTYDGRAWSRSQSERRVAERMGPDASDPYIVHRRPNLGRDRRMWIELEPIDPPVIFMPLRAVALRLKPQSQAVLTEPLSIQRGPEGEFRYSGTDTHGLRYELFLPSDNERVREDLIDAERPRYLTIPAAIPKRVRDLAHEWTDDKPTPLAKALAIEDHLKHDFTYDTASPSGGTKQPVDHFLFESKRGHCEFFSTSMALLLREIGIPSRNVSGFIGGTYNRFGQYYAVRQGDAHSWIEAHIDGGWHSFDPTPSLAAQPLHETTGPIVYVRDLIDALSQRWNRYVVGYDLKTQIHLFEEMNRHYERFRSRQGLSSGLGERLTRAPVIASGTAVLLIAAYVVWRKRARKASPQQDPLRAHKSDKRLEQAASLFRMLESALSVHGIARPPALPPLRHAQDLEAQKHPLAGEVLDLTHVYLRARFGGEYLDDEGKRAFEQRVRAIKQRPAHPPPT